MEGFILLKPREIKNGKSYGIAWVKVVTQNGKPKREYKAYFGTVKVLNGRIPYKSRHMFERRITEMLRDLGIHYASKTWDEILDQINTKLSSEGVISIIDI